MPLNPKHLTRAIKYQIDGLGDGADYARWLYAGHAEGVVTFHGPRREQCVLDTRRLHEIAAGHLRYASID